MDKSFSISEFWKSFNLGIELDIAGTFIYNGLKSFHDIKNFESTSDIFEFLYNISIGIERLAKIAIILIEHEDNKEQNKFEKSLITHNHLELIKRIKKKHKLNLSTVHNKFLQILTNFYKSMRYDRYNITEVADHEKEKRSLIDFISSELKINYSNDFLQLTTNDDRIKIFIGKIIGKFSTTIYDIIWEEAHRLNVYTYELRYDSKAAKIFYAKEFNFLNEINVNKELLIFLMHAKGDKGVVDFIRSLKPLDLDIGEACEFIESFENPLITSQMQERIKLAYEEEIDDVKYRLEALKALTNCHAFYYGEDEDVNSY